MKKKFSENNKFSPNIGSKKDILKIGKRFEFHKMFKDNNNIKNQKKEVLNNKESEKIFNEKNYDSYMKNKFDKLYHEKLQIENRKKLREEFLEKNLNLNGYKKEILNQNSKISLKELLLSDKIKELYKNNISDNINKDEIWPKNIKNLYLDNIKFIDEEKNEPLSPIKNLGFFVEEETKNEFFD